MIHISNYIEILATGQWPLTIGVVDASVVLKWLLADPQIEPY